MDPQELLAKISELTKEIEKLPRGYISQRPLTVRCIIITSGRKTGRRKAGI